jgi:hypothetical protein
MSSNVDRSFFGTLGALSGTAQQENQFSRTFHACFEKSQFFRSQVLDELRAVCGIRMALPKAEQWNCAVEVPTPSPGGGRIDIRLTSTSRTRRPLPVFYLESKLGSPLTREQLERYRKRGVKYLIAITKSPPDVGRKEIADLGVFTLRWQDLHRRLVGKRGPTGSDRFIAQSLAAYMEELGMAYREDLTLKDLELCRRVLNTIATPDKEIVPRNGFEIADACLSLLKDVRLRFVDEFHPELSTYHVWGPGYFNWIDDDGNRWDAFGWDLYKGKWSEARFGCRFWLPERSALLCSVQFRGTRVSEKYEERPLKSILSKSGTVNQEALLSWLDRCAKRWKVT